MSQDFDFNACLILESWVVFNNFHSNIISSLMVEAFKSLSEAALAEFFDNFKSVSEMIFQYDFIVASIIIIASIIVFKQAGFDL